MRTAQLKINGQSKEGILVAGGPGFKVYSVSDYDGWVVKSGRQTRLVEEGSNEFMVVSQYVNLQYQPASEQQGIKDKFDSFLTEQAPSIPSPNQEPTL
jgi:hypothetical protein